MISKLPLKREEVAMMKLRLESIEEDETPEEVSIILEDLNLLSSSINSMYESAIPWTTENFESVANRHTD